MLCFQNVLRSSRLWANSQPDDVASVICSTLVAEVEYNIVGLERSMLATSATALYSLVD